jgi:arginine utilization protein RocB
MVDVNGKDLQKSSLSSSGDCVGSVVRVGPRIGTVGEATVSKVVYDALVRIIFRAHEDQTGGAPMSGTNTRVSNVYSLLQRVRTTRVIENCTA